MLLKSAYEPLPAGTSTLASSSSTTATLRWSPLACQL